MFANIGTQLLYLNHHVSSILYIRAVGSTCTCISQKETYNKMRDKYIREKIFLILILILLYQTLIGVISESKCSSNMIIWKIPGRPITPLLNPLLLKT